MPERAGRTLREIMLDGVTVHQALVQAAREAVRRHKRLGHSIVISRNGKIQWIGPDEIQVEDVPPVAER